MASYLRLAVTGVRSEAVADKIALHLQRFLTFFHDSYGHDRISAYLKRDVVTWQMQLRKEGLAPATVNNHLASLSAFTTWVHAQAPRIFPLGDPAKGIGELGLPPERKLASVCRDRQRPATRQARWALYPTPIPGNGVPR